MANLPEKHASPARGGGRSLADTLDNALLVGVAVVVGYFALRLFGWAFAAFFTVVKLAVLAAIVYVVARVAMRRRAD